MNAPNDRASGALLLDLATALALISALIYATGWTYAYHYFSHFELGLLMLDIPVQYFFMYGFWVFKAWGWLIVVLYGLVALPFLIPDPYIAPRLRRLTAERPGLLRHGQVLLVLLVLLAFLLAWWLAAISADRYYREQQAVGFSAYPHVRIWPKEPPPTDPRLRTLYAALPEGGYRLLLQNRNALFLFKVPRDGKPARLAVIQLDLSDIRALKILS
jgi:hypothetical protein